MNQNTSNVEVRPVHPLDGHTDACGQQDELQPCTATGVLICPECLAEFEPVEE